jgi:AraC-like DNA-binding protein
MAVISDYFITEVDKKKDTIYCMHDAMGEKDIPFHQHHKGQFLYTEGGVVYVTTADKTYFLPARHYMWIPSGVRHGIHPSSADVIMRNLYFPDEVGQPAFFERTAIYPITELMLQLVLFSNRFEGHIDKKDRTAYRLTLALKTVLPQLSHYQLPLALPYAKEKRLKEVIAYMHNNLQANLLFPAVASAFGLSERSLSRLFQSDVGMSFIQYLTLQRMIRAIQYLLEDKIPVKEVASLVGYNSIPTFSNTFYKTLGIRPSEYMKIKDVISEEMVVTENNISLS